MLRGGFPCAPRPLCLKSCPTPSRPPTDGHSQRSSRVRDAPSVRAPEDARQFPRHVLKVARAHDVIAVEDGSRLVPRDAHGNALDDAGVDYVPHSRAPEVMPQHARGTCLPTGRLPGSAEIADPLAVVSAAQMRKEPGGDRAGLPLQALDTLDLALEKRREFRREVDHAPVLVLRGP